MDNPSFFILQAVMAPKWRRPNGSSKTSVLDQKYFILFNFFGYIFESTEFIQSSDVSCSYPYPHGVSIPVYLINFNNKYYIILQTKFETYQKKKMKCVKGFFVVALNNIMITGHL